MPRWPKKEVSVVAAPSKPKKGRKPKEDIVRTCMCGCGGVARKMFAQGHDMKLRSEVLAFADGRGPYLPEFRRAADYLTHAHWMTPDIAGKLISKLQPDK